MEGSKNTLAPQDQHQGWNLKCHPSLLVFPQYLENSKQQPNQFSDGNVVHKGSQNKCAAGGKGGRTPLFYSLLLIRKLTRENDWLILYDRVCCHPIQGILELDCFVWTSTLTWRGVLVNLMSACWATFPQKDAKRAIKCLKQCFLLGIKEREGLHSEILALPIRRRRRVVSNIHAIFSYASSTLNSCE